MALARVVTFEGVDKDRIDQLRSEMEQSGERPEGLPASEIIVLHDSEEDYKTGDEALNAMPTGDTPGRRTSVTKYDVAIRMAD